MLVLLIVDRGEEADQYTELESEETISKKYDETDKETSSESNPDEAIIKSRSEA